MRSYETDIQRQRNEKIQTSKNRLYSVLDDRARFNNQADMAEFSQNEMGKYNAQMDQYSDEMSLMGIEKGYSNEQIAQLGAVNAAGSQMWMNAGDSVSSISQRRSAEKMAALQAALGVATASTSNKKDKKDS
jgi:hypothetical protein